MLFALICVDKPGALEIRKANREAHLAYLRESPVVFAGPFLAADGETMDGSLIVLDMASREAVEAWRDADPYGRAGLFESVTIRGWKRAIG